MRVPPRVPMVPHNAPLVLLGAGVLWFGWFGFNAGSPSRPTGSPRRRSRTRTPPPRSPSLRCGHHPGGRVRDGAGVSLAIGALSGLVSYAAIQIRAKSRLDDSLDVCSCHGLAGVAGALLTGVFATKAADPTGGKAQMGVQMVANPRGHRHFGGRYDHRRDALVNMTLGAEAGVREQLTALDLSEHGEEVYFGDLGRPAAPGSSLSEGVIVWTAPAGGLKKSAPMAC